MRIHKREPIDMCTKAYKKSQANLAMTSEKLNISPSGAWKSLFNEETLDKMAKDVQNILF